MTAAITADIIGSRRLHDRAGAQRDLISVLQAAGTDLSLPPLLPTIGDEFQRAYPTLAQALKMTLAISLSSPIGIQLRFGIGVGRVTDESDDVASWDGPAWWAARDAVNRVSELQRRAVPHARTWVLAAPGQDDPMESIALANAYVLARDAIIAGMGARARRLTYGRWLGATQRELASAEGITQSAVSQALAAAGAGAILEGLALLERAEARA